MLKSTTTQLAEPGRLVVGQLEDATQFDPSEPNNSCLQVVKDSVSEVDGKDALELLRLAPAAVQNLQELVSDGFRLELAHQPIRTALVQWRNWVFGPFNLTPVPGSGREEGGAYTFTPAHPDMAVYRWEAAAFHRMAGDARRETITQVSRTADHRQRSYVLVPVRHEVVLAKGYEKALVEGAERVGLEPIERKLTRLSKDLLSRAQRKELRALLDNMTKKANETSTTQEVLDLIRAVDARNQTQMAALDELARSMVASGALGEDRIERVQQQITERYIQENSAKLRSQIDQEIASRQEALRLLETQLQNAKQVWDQESEVRRRALDQELEERNQEASRALHVQQEEVERRQIELDRQRDLLQINLEEVTRELRERGDEVVNRFLTIAPLLGAFHPATAGPGRQPIPITNLSQPETESPVFRFPTYLDQTVTESEELLEEDAFFDRFQQVVSESGFTYRRLDLIRFHLSVKCGEIAIIGGPSGTGKSSLPQLYGRALLGGEGQNSRPGCLMVNVSPSWLDSRDLLGHVNTLERRFHPAESGLYEYIIVAEEEYRRRRARSGIALACLDEMNLAQVEHYFNDFMMVLERKDARQIRCFTRGSVGPACPFRDRGTLDLPPTLRTVGTVNYDETTRLLSDRLLDRANVIQLACESLPTSGQKAGVPTAAVGRMITLGDFDRWMGTAALPANLAALIDEMRPLLLKLGCPISPRVYRSICLFVGSAQPLLAPQSAFDVQLAQRIVPKIRSLVTDRQRESLDRLIQLVDTSRAGAFDETLAQLEGIRQMAGEQLVEE